MGHTLKIVHGSTSIDLSTGDYRIKTYSPTPPRANAETIVEGISVFIEADSVANLQSRVRDIENAFYLAQQRRIKRLGDRVYLTFLEDGGTTTYRSEIYASKEKQLPGKVSVDTQWLRSVMWDIKAIEAKISLERRNYWEENTETELSLSNGGGSGTGGRVIYNPHTTAVFTGVTVSFDNATSRISDSGSGFGIFSVGDVISIRGSVLTSPSISPSASISPSTSVSPSSSVSPSASISSSVSPSASVSPSVSPSASSSVSPSVSPSASSSVSPSVSLSVSPSVSSSVSPSPSA